MSKPLNQVEYAAKRTMEEIRRPYPDIDDEDFWRIYEKWRGETLIPAERLYASYLALRATLANGVEGAIVECGVFRGGSLAFFMDVVLRFGKADREFWAYDTFDGFPENVVETIHNGTTFTCESWHTENFREIFDRNLARCDYPRELVHVVVGDVLETIPIKAPERIAFLHLDTDYYEATLHEFKHLYHRVPHGCAVEVDDYNAFEGSRRATDEFLSGLDRQPMMYRSDRFGRLLVKV